MIKKLGAVVGGVALALGGALAAAPAAHAAGCHALSCNGVDPAAAGCAGDAYTVASVNTPQGLVELRYSPSCVANWARISNSSPGTWFWAQDCNNGYNQQFYLPSGYTSGWTYMVDGTPAARAGDSGGHTGCF